MKKYLYTLLFMAVALFSASALVSCGDDDDDNTGSGNEKPAIDEVYVYKADVSEDMFNLYDISITLHSGAKSKVVKLDKANNTEVLNGTYNSKTEFKVYRFVYDNADGSKGVDYVEANVTVKPEAAAFAEALDPEKPVILLTSAAYIQAEFQANGHYSFGAIGTTDAKIFDRETLLTDHGGKKAYEGITSALASGLSKKNPEYK